MFPTAPGETLPPGLGADNMLRASSRLWIGLAGLTIVVAGWAVYSNSFDGAFVFDDIGSILHNPTIQQGWWRALSPPAGTTTAAGRPLMNLSLALNYRLGGFNVWGYHAVNLAIQLLAGLTLFGLARRTLELPMLRGRYGTVALPLAWMIALLWTIHPLQTESVAYIVQRAESLMGLFYLLTLYCFVRGVNSSRTWIWHLSAAIACLLGMFTKETMVTAPLMVLLYDRTFITGNFTDAWRRHGKLYAALVCTWLPLAWLVATVTLPGNATQINSGLEGLSPVMKSYVYALKQCEAVVHYLWLSVCPHPLVFYYGNDVVDNPLDVAAQIVVLALLVGGTLYALWRKPALGFLGAWFFVILAPTSSVVPVAGQTMVEHHVYLSLAAVIVLAVLGLNAVMGRYAGLAGFALAIGLGGLTFERNHDYHSDISLWADTVGKLPNNLRAIKSLGESFIATGQLRDALPSYETVLRMNPDDAEAESNLGSLLNSLGRPSEALIHVLHGVALDSKSPPLFYNLGNTYRLLNQPGLARDAYIAAVHLDPNYADAHTNLANIYLLNFGQTDQAVSEYEAALKADPRHISAHSGLANIYLQTHQWAEAIPHLKAVIQLKPDFGEAYLGLGNALMAVGRTGDAIPQYEAAVRFMPGNADARSGLDKARLLASPPGAVPPSAGK